MAEYIGHSSSEIKEAVRGQLHILWPLHLEGLIALDYRFSLESLPQMRHIIKLDLFDPEELEAFHEYRERRLLKVPLDLLHIEPIREPTPSVSLEGSFKENS